MANVPISGKLKSDTRNIIFRLRNAEQAAEPAPAMLRAINLERPATGEPDTLARLRTQAWGVLADTPFEMHPELSREHGARINVIITDRDEADGKREGGIYANDFQLEVSGWPRFVSTTQAVAVKRADHPFFEEWSNWYVTDAETKTRWAGISLKVNTFLEQCKSLNEAVKLWPDVRRYVDAPYLERMDAKVEKVKADPSAALAALEAIDKGILAASHVSARMAGAAA